MATANMNIAKLSDDRYRVSFETGTDKVVCEVAVKVPGKPNKGADQERQQAALRRAKTLARAFHEAIPDR